MWTGVDTGIVPIGSGLVSIQPGSESELRMCTSSGFGFWSREVRVAVAPNQVLRESFQRTPLGRIAKYPVVTAVINDLVTDFMSREISAF
jgi:hypothetical protein